MNSTDEILAGYDSLQAGQEAFYKDLHQHPELSHAEHRTAGRVAERLQEYGFTVEAGIGGTGVVGVLSNGSGPTLLPLFQPAEETGEGAQDMVDDGLLKRIPAPDVALSQHLLPGIAGTVSTCSGPFMSAADSIKVTVYGRGGHGSMPQNTIDPVVLAAMIIVRLQTVVSREVPPGETAVLTVGSIQAGSRSNVISDHAVLELNMRSYSQQTRQRMLAAIQRIVRAECQASGSPQDPEFETIFSFPITDNDAATTDRVAAAFAHHFGDRAGTIAPQTVSEDFSKIPDAAGIPYTYWAIGFTDAQTYRAAEKAGRLKDLPTNHSAKFLPPLQPCLRTGTEALTTAALGWLAPE